MDNLSPTSPLVPGLGGFGAMTTIPMGHMNDDHSIDPTSPTTLKHSNSSSHSSSSSSGSRRSHRHKERPDSTYAGLSSRDLARMLVEEEIRTSHFTNWAQTLSSQLSQQKQRADDAERRATHSAHKLKEETEARIRLEQAMKQKAEELKLYQVQLKKAQSEIYKAQDALAEVEKMRDEAEHAAAKARSIARRLREQRLVDIAREEGRRIGLKEGLARGQEVDYVDRGYPYLEGGAAVEEVEDEEYYGRSTRSRHSPPPRTATTTAPPSTQGGGRAPGVTDPIDERTLNPMTVTTPLRMPTPEPPSPKLPQPVSVPVPVPTPEPTIPPRPISVASVGTRPTTYKPGPTPPDVWIPVSDRDGIRLPSPHEFSPRLAYPPALPSQPQLPSPVSPTPPPHRSPRSQPLMVRPPASDPHHSDRDSSATGTSYSPVVDRRESHHRRRRSSGSQTSTAMSQMDILGSPDHGRERALSSITEERPSAVASPNNTPSIRSLQSNPNVFQSTAAYTPSSHVPVITLDRAPTLHKSASMSSEEYKFDVVPPSRPTSNTYSDSLNIPGVTTSQHDMLSAEDAHHRPLPVINPAPTQVQSPAVVVSEPPPGFVPFVSSSPAQPIRSPLQNPAPLNPEPLSPGGGWSYFQNLPSAHVEEPPTAPVIPASLSSRSKKALSNMSGTSSQSKYATPTQTPARMPSTGSRNRRPPSTATSTDDEVSSDLSSDNSLSTPPAPRRLLTPIYGPVGLPPAVPGTGRTAPVTLPTQTPGTGRTNAVSLPQLQSQQQADGMPPPGVMNEPPPPAQPTTTSMRGRGSAPVNNRGGRKRR